MSNIPRAREYLHKLLKDYGGDVDIRQAVNRALGLMYREPFVRKAATKRKVIDKKLRARVIRLSDKHPNMTIMEIAHATGLRSPGRVSEILHGKR